MEIRTSTVAVVAASCITIGAAGAFLASRPSGAPHQPAASASDVATGGVEQSEAVVSDAPVAPAVEIAPVQAAPVAPSPSTSLGAGVAPRAKSRPAPVAPVRPVIQEARAAVTESRPVAPTPAEPKPIISAPIAPVAPLAPAEPPAPRFVDLVVSTDSVLGLQLETSVTSEKARVEDEVVARVTRDVRVGNR